MRNKGWVCALHVLSSTRACLYSTRGDASLLPLPRRWMPLLWLMVCWDGGTGQTHGRWRMASVKPWHRAIQLTEMIDVKSNFKHPQLKRAGQAEARLQRSDNTRPHLNPDWQADKYHNTALVSSTERVFRRAGRFKDTNNSRTNF